MQDGADLVQHINFFNHTISDLQRIEFRIENEDKPMILLCPLPPLLSLAWEEI